MFAMHHTYPYPGQPQPQPARQYSGHGTSSAFSSSALPDEDWTKISDLAERRRIQNRIAQRNYRKKLKARLELYEQKERKEQEKAGGRSPSGSGSEKASSASKSNNSKRQPAKKTQKATSPSSSSAPRQLSRAQYTPPLQEDEYHFAQAFDERERAHSPPGMAPAPYYSSYPPPPGDEMFMASFGSLPYRPVTTEAYPEYLAASTGVSVTLPSFNHFSDVPRREPYHQGEETMPYISYGSYVPSGVEMGAGAASPYDPPMPHTPPLSHSYDHSANCSDSGYEYPATPLSLPGSPGTVHEQQL